MNRPAVRLALRLVSLLIAAFALQRFVWMPWKANHVLSEVEARSRRALNSGDPVETAILARQNIGALEGISAATRDDANYYMLYAANARFLNRLDVAAAEYTAALEHADHRPEIYYERGLVYMSMGKMDAAIADLARAAQFNPNIIFTLSGELQDRVVKAAGLQ